MKIIKKLALCALFTNVAYSADLPELPEDHPIKTAVQMAKFAIGQHLFGPNTGGAMFRTIEPHLPLIKKTILNNFEQCIGYTLSMQQEKFVFVIKSEFKTAIKRNYFQHNPPSSDIGYILDEITAEIDAYIHQSFETHFKLRMEDKKFASAYKLSLVYRDENTAHAENTAKANTWIAEVKAKATAEVEQIGNVVYALFLEKALQTTEHMKATRIIDSFEKVDADFHEQLNALFYAIVNKKTPIVPFAAEQLLLARKLEDMVFRINDEDDA
jgi:hypothetical protein